MKEQIEAKVVDQKEFYNPNAEEGWITLVDHNGNAFPVIRSNGEWLLQRTPTNVLLKYLNNVQVHKARELEADFIANKLGANSSSEIANKLSANND